MIQSAACNQFPQIVWRKGQKQLWNPIHRQALKNRPEERVRLRIVEYLLASRWSKHRISTEEAIDLPRREAKLRTDLICYTKDFTPFLLVECKAENVKLSAQTADQIARYNQQVAAPYLLMTNGRTDFWYQIDEDQSVKRLQQIPDGLPKTARPKTDFHYWQHRGFAGAKAAPDLRGWLNKTVPVYFIDADSTSCRYLSFKNSPSDAALSHYYHIQPVAGNRLALSFIATAFGGSRLIGILNRNSKNEAVIEINLDLLFDERRPNASLYWSGDTQNIDMRKHLPPLADSRFEMNRLAPAMHQLMIDAIK